MTFDWLKICNPFFRDIISYIEQKPEFTSKELSSKFGVQTTAQALRKLNMAGLITRVSTGVYINSSRLKVNYPPTKDRMGFKSDASCE